MFITKAEITKELVEEDCWVRLSPKEKKMFLAYCINGLDENEAYKDVYVDEDSDRANPFPAKKAAKIVAKDDFQECFDIYAELLRETAAVKTNAHLFNIYWNMACYSVFDFIDENGEFRYKSVEEAQERLGIKAVAIQSIDTTMHPRDPDRTIRKVNFVSREKALKELAKFSKFYGEQEGSAGSGLDQVIVNTSAATYTKEQDDARRKELKLVAEET